jgi:monoamine oxidase
VKEILKQLSLIHNIPIPENTLKECIYQFWGNDPFGAGYHNFYSGYYIPSVMQSIRKPWEEESIFFVGEAFSNETGWVEGAFQTA